MQLSTNYTQVTQDNPLTSLLTLFIGTMFY